MGHGGAKILMTCTARGPRRPKIVPKTAGLRDVLLKVEYLTRELLCGRLTLDMVLMNSEHTLDIHPSMHTCI